MRESRRKKSPIRSDIGWSTADRIGIFGKDLPSEEVGHMNLGDMGFLEIKGRLPNANSVTEGNFLIGGFVHNDRAILSGPYAR